MCFDYLSQVFSGFNPQFYDPAFSAISTCWLDSCTTPFSSILFASTSICELGTHFEPGTKVGDSSNSSSRSSKLSPFVSGGMPRRRSQW